MKKEQVIAALESLRVITNETHMIVIGTQSLHGMYPNVADEIIYSREIDVVLKHKASLANWISDVVGDETPFEVERGYFIDHVRPKPGLPVLADGWETRLTRNAEISGCIVDFLSPQDLAIAKLGAGREKDVPFIVGMVERGIVSTNDIESLIPLVPVEYRQKVENFFELLISVVQVQKTQQKEKLNIEILEKATKEAQKQYPNPNDIRKQIATRNELAESMGLSKEEIANLTYAKPKSPVLGRQ